MRLFAQRRFHYVLACVVLLSALLVSVQVGAAEKVPIRMWVHWQPGPVKVWLKEFAQEFMAENPDIELTIETDVSSPRTQVLVQVAAGVGPDINYDVNTVMGRFVNNGIAVPVDKYMDKNLKDDVIPEVMQSVTFDGKSYALPFSMWPWLDLVNNRVLTEAGISSYPKDWDGMISMASRLTRTRNDGTIELFGWRFQKAGYIAYAALQIGMEQLGRPLIEEGASEANLHNPVAREALTYWRDLCDAGMPHDEGWNPFTDILNDKVGVEGWFSGYSVSDLMSSVTEDDRKKISFERIVGPKPGQDLGIYQASVLYMVQGSKHPDEAWRVIKAFTDKSNIKQYLITHGGSQTVRRSLLGDNDLLSRPFSRDQVGLLYSPLVSFGANHLYYDNFRDNAGEELVKALNGEVSVTEALENAERYMNQVIAEEMAKK